MQVIGNMIADLVIKVFKSEKAYQTENFTKATTCRMLQTRGGASQCITSLRRSQDPRLKSRKARKVKRRALTIQRFCKGGVLWGFAEVWSFVRFCSSVIESLIQEEGFSKRNKVTRSSRDVYTRQTLLFFCWNLLLGLETLRHLSKTSQRWYPYPLHDSYRPSEVCIRFSQIQSKNYYRFYDQEPWFIYLSETRKWISTKDPKFLGFDFLCA